MVKTITEIMDQEDHHTVFMVSHGASVANFYKAFQKYAKVEKKERFYNCCVLKYTYENGIFVLEELFNKNITE